MRMISREADMVRYETRRDDEGTRYAWVDGVFLVCLRVLEGVCLSAVLPDLRVLI